MRPLLFGGHCIFESPDSMRLCLEAGATVLKVLNNSYWVDERVLALKPKPLIIGRHIVEDDPPNENYVQHDPVEVARWYVAQMESDIRLNPHIDAWEGPNEPGDGGDELSIKAKYMTWLGKFEAERLRILRVEFDRAGVAGNPSTGTPYEPTSDPMFLWRRFDPAFGAIRLYGGYLGLHEYAGLDRRLDGLLWGRYRGVLDYTRQTGGGVKIVITECGFDSTMGDPWGDAWRATIPLTHAQIESLMHWYGLRVSTFPHLTAWLKSAWESGIPNLNFHLTPDEYVEQLVWYHQMLERDPEVVGATLFTYGHSTGWPDFDLEGSSVTNLLINYAQGRPSMPIRLTQAPFQTPASWDPAQTAAELLRREGFTVLRVEPKDKHTLLVIQTPTEGTDDLQGHILGLLQSYVTRSVVVEMESGMQTSTWPAPTFLVKVIADTVIYLADRVTPWPVRPGGIVTPSYPAMKVSLKAIFSGEEWFQVNPTNPELWTKADHAKLALV